MDITKKPHKMFLKNQQDRHTVDQHKHRGVSSALGRPDAGWWASGKLERVIWINSAPPA